MERNYALDGLRAIAVIAVIAFHCDLPGAMGGYIGVDLFFVLSGYLITGMLVQEKQAAGSINYGHFLARRASRLLPAIFAILCAYLALELTMIQSGKGLRDATLAAFAISDYAYAWLHVPKVLNHTWSLAVEQKFYLIWPFVIGAIATMKRAKAIKILIAIYVATTVWRFVDYLAWQDWNWTYHRFDTRLSGFSAGATLALVPFKFSDWWRPHVEKAALTILVVTMFLDSWKSAAGIFIAIPVAELVAVALIICVTSGAGELRQLLMAKPVVYVGAISYGIYLWHYPISLILRGGFDRLGTFGLTLLLSTLFATASWFLIERPVSVRVRHMLRTCK